MGHMAAWPPVDEGSGQWGPEAALEVKEAPNGKATAGGGGGGGWECVGRPMPEGGGLITQFTTNHNTKQDRQKKAQQLALCDLHTTRLRTGALR